MTEVTCLRFRQFREQFSPQPNPAPPAQQIKPPVQLGQPRPFKKKGIRQLMQPMIKGK